MLHFMKYFALIFMISIITSYDTNSYWVSGGQLTECGQKAIDLLANAHEEGLKPANYQFAVNAAKSSPATAEDAINRAMIQYVDDVSNGHFHPRIADRRIHMQPPQINAAVIVANGKASGSCNWMYQQSPPYPGYQRLKERLKRYHQEGRTEYIRKIEINMERWRWMPRAHAKKYIIVNVAGQQLEAIENGHAVVKSKIIVGKAQLETPVFAANMTSLDFNPVWNVPHSIASKEELPRLKSHPTYIAHNQMVVYQHVGNDLVTVNPNSVNWSNYSANNFPFKIIQKPGPHNPLGKLRFNIQSPFSIYLHSTSNPNLFNSANRFFSHGCIRVEKVVSLAEFVLSNPQVWNRETIENNMEGYRTKSVRLPYNIPVYINYFTLWIDEDGTGYSAPDIYGEDKLLWNMMSRH